ncbi:glutathione synthase/RimK-type ligase-like ATP-grasp enzyme [Sodalis ligni]|uniref:Glutathione synthase/RimK-type ligase-like ATP-grasp enzyme n=2 Tax=Sodalis ligni TaxID=2697027 RepID=A0A4R1NAA5_9GAMM|nr:glutathione synthase/RimK-type ligase-like ATP-grasp enzyme [Sodalis ligni]
MPDAAYQPATLFLGLAPFLRMSIAGTDFTSLAEEMLVKAEHYPDDAELWMNLSTVMMCLKQLKAGLAIQGQALAMQRVFRLPAARQPAKLRLLMLMIPGDLSANMPLDCLLENSDIDLLYYYITPDTPLAWPVPEHDAVLVAISAADESREPLAQLEQALARWPKPVINAPQFIPASERYAASMLLQNVPGLAICPALHIGRTTLQRVADKEIPLSGAMEGYHFPVILRPVGSHGGRGLARIDSLPAVAAYLADVPAEHYFLSRFVDYSGPDGLFRKFRIVLIAGVPYACHMAISSHWMIHYVNAGMYEDEKKRAEEAAFFTHFDAFAQRHRSALAAIYQRTRLDYLGIDCAETQDGDLLVFEIDPAMVVHAMDQEDIFPHKQYHMQKVKDALRELLLIRAAENPISKLL